MASMISGDFVEAYVLKNACKEKIRKAEENAVNSGKLAAGVEEETGDGASEKKTAEDAGNKGEGAGALFGLVKKKVHPKVDGAGASS